MNRFARLLAVTLLVCTSHAASAARLDDRGYAQLRQLARSIADQAGPERPIPLLLNHQDDPRVLRLLQEYFGKADRNDDFLSIAAKQAELQPWEPQIQAVYLKALHAAGMADSVIPVASRGIDGMPDTLTAVWGIVGDQLSELGMHAAALDVYRRGRAALGDQYALGREIAFELIALGRLENALDELVIMFSNGAEEKNIAREVAYRVIATGDQATGLLIDRLDKELDTANNEIARNIRALLMDICLSAGREKEAYNYFSVLIRELDNQGARKVAQMFISRASRLQLYESSLAGFALSDTLKLISRQNALMGRAEILLRLGRYQEAEHHYIELTAFDGPPIATMAWRKLGDLYLNHMDRPGEALACFRRVEETGGLEKEQLLEIKIRIAESFIRLKSLTEAEALCRELIEDPENEPSESRGALLLLGDVLFYGGQPDSAALAYDMFAKLSLADSRANDAMGKIYLIRHDRIENNAPSRTIGKALYAARTGDIQQARDLFAELLREQPDSLYRAQVYYQMGRMYERESEFSLALGTYGQLIDEIPEHQLAPLAELRMGIILLDEVRDEVRARRHLERVVMEYPPGVATPRARRLLRSLDDEKL